MKLSNYKENISKSQDELKTDSIDLQVKRAKQKAHLKVMDVEEQLLKCENDISAATMDSSLDISVLGQLMDQHALLSRKKNQLEDIINQLFG